MYRECFQCAWITALYEDNLVSEHGERGGGESEPNEEYPPAELKIELLSPRQGPCACWHGIEMSV